VRVPVKVKINEKSSRTTIVSDEIAHKNVEDIVIDGNGFAETRHEAI
jgi:hypothetical protein